MLVKIFWLGFVYRLVGWYGGKEGGREEGG